MVKIIGYGEDALTYWALTEQIESVLTKLSDSSSHLDCLLFYRPSFGRKGGPHASFGEFDAILATPQSIYLIESKWDGSSQIKKGIIELENNQILRHKIFVWYFNRWNKEKFKNWQLFIEKYEKEFQKEFNGKNIASTKNRLSANIDYVFNQLDSYNKNVNNVLLFFNSVGSIPPTRVIPDDFQLIIIDYPGGYFEMKCQWRKSEYANSFP
jgi:hypothetical protein